MVDSWTSTPLHAHIIGPAHAVFCRGIATMTDLIPSDCAPCVARHPNQTLGGYGTFVSATTFGAVKKVASNEKA